MVLTEKLSFSYCHENVPCPTLIETLIGEDGVKTDLFFHERIKSDSGDIADRTREAKTPVKAPSVKYQSTNTQSVDLDITGSPLKAGFDPNEVFDNSTDDLLVITNKAKTPDYSGLDVRSARTLLSRLNCEGSAAVPLQSNLVLCRPDQKSNTLYLGNKIKDGKLLSVSKTTWEGPVPGKSLNLAMENFTRKHGVGTGGRGRTVTSSRSEYLLSGEETQSCLVLQCCWDRSGSMLETPPPDSTSKLKVSLVPGDRRFACDKQNVEIDQLEGLIAGLAGEGLVWTGREEDTCLEDEVLEVLEASRKLKPSIGILDSDSDNVLSLEARQDVDITDMLWTVLSRAQSFAELTDSLSLVFNTILAEEIRPFIYSGNKSGMAGILRDLIRTGTIPDLSGSKPLALLIEMGIEKLGRDSSHFLLSSDLASKEAVDPYLCGDSFQQSVELIKRLHMVVELTFACQTYLNLPSSSLKTLVHSALLQFINLEINQRVQLEFPIQTSDVKHQLENSRPGFWQMRLESEGLKSVAQLQVEKPLEVYPAPTIQHAGDSTELLYYLILHTEVKHDV